MHDEIKEVIIFPNKKRVIFLTLGSLLFVSIGVLFLVIKNEIQVINIILKIVGSLSILFFGTTFLYGMSRLLVNKPVLMINQEAVFNNTSMVSGDWIKWEDIKSYRIFSYLGQRYIGIELKNPVLYYHYMNWFKKLLAYLNKKLTKVNADIVISEVMMSMSLEEVVKEMDYYKTIN